MIERMTMRAFRARIGRITKPTLVNDGIWFPESSDVLEAIAAGEDPCVPIFKGISTTSARAISKHDQAKGRTRK